MRRRDVFVLASGAAMAALVPAWAQQARSARIGVLLLGGAEPFLKHFREGLAALGYADGRNIEIMLRAANSDAARLPQLAEEIAAWKPAIIVASETPAVQAAKNAAPTTPIVMAASGDPIGTGLIASLARPGGYITGLSAQAAELAGKSLELMRELLPGLKRAAVLALERNPLTKPFFAHAERAAGTLGLELATLTVPNAAGLGDAFAKLEQAATQALVVQPSLPLKPVAELCLAKRLPAVSITRAFADAGGLMSYAASLVERYRGAADYVDKILKGAKAAELPVGQPTKFELVLNMRTAKALRVSVPDSLLNRANDFIE
jgi:putative tryptophan/tyrosine transport system substrate-binding protein